MNFKDFLLESKEPYSLKIEFNVKPEIVRDSDHLKELSKDIFGDDVKTYHNTRKRDFKTGFVKDIFEVIPSDKSLLNKGNIGELKKVFLKISGEYKMDPPMLKMSISKIDTSLENIFPNSSEEVIYKKLFGKTEIKTGKVIKTSIDKEIRFTVSSVISNEMILGQGYYKYGDSHKKLLFVKGKGYFDENNAPNDLKKYF